MKRTVNEHSLKTVMEYFVKGYKFKKGEELFDYEWYVDPAKDTVFIITYVKQELTLKEKK